MSRHFKRLYPQAVDVSAMFRAGAKKLHAEMVEARKRPIPVEAEQSDVLTVVQTLSGPDTVWEVIHGLPYGLDSFTVRASQADAERNQESLPSLLRRRLRRGFRDRLIGGNILREDTAKARVLRMQVFVADVRMGDHSASSVRHGQAEA